MRIKFYLFFCILLSQTGFTQWYWQNPSQQGNRIDDFQFIDSLIGFAGGYGGMILKTTDGGNNWYSLPSPANNFIYDIYFLNVNTGWLSDYDTKKVYKTTNGGDTWNLISITDTGAISEFWFLNDSVGFGATYYQFLKTTDGGATWFNSGVTGGLYPTVYTISFVNQNIGFIGGWLGLKKTVNGGQSWQTISLNNFYNFTPEKLFAYDAQYVFMAGMGEEFGGGVYYAICASNDGGISWTVVEMNDYITDIYFESPSKGWICSDSIYKTMNGGITWENIGIPSDYIEFNGSQSWITSENTISYSPDEWTTIIPQIKSVFTGFLSDGFAKDTLNIFACGSNYTIVGTHDGGSTWNKLYSDSLDRYLYRIITDSSNIWAVGSLGIVLKSTDNGTSWRKTYIQDCPHLNDITFLGEGMGFAAGVYDGGGALFHTTDGGDSWIVLKTFPEENEVVQVQFSTYNLGWLTTRDKIYKSTDGGKMWEEVMPLYYSHFDVSGDSAWFISGNRLFRTTDAGLSFTSDTVYQYNGQVSFSDVNINFVNASRGFVSTGDSRVFTTTDGGGTWNQMNFPAGVGISAQYFLNERKGWVFGDWGTIIKYDPYFTYVNDNNTDGPSTYYLSYNYPNPFNPATRLSYSIPVYSRIIIKVYNILGREIATLVNEEKPAGTYEVAWNAEGLPSGVYFCQLRSGSFIETRKMILMK